ncbi:MAG: hypothetical protein MJ056_06635 [Akkermansia sp.]|nr:hypothetical protein [Akkermansia sp.]
MKSILIAALCSLGMLHAVEGPPENYQKVDQRVLFIGNSYTYVNDLPKVFDALCKAGRQKVGVDSFTEGSCALVDFFELPQFEPAKKKVATGKFTYVVLQDQSLVPSLRPDWTLAYTAKWKELVAAANATPVYFMTWARCINGTNRPDMAAQDKTTAVYCQAALRDGVTLVPCGEVWREWNRLYPGTTLYERDGSHPNPVGVYLNACTFYKVLCKKSPVGLPSKYPITGPAIVDVKPQLARQCQQLVDKVVDSFNPQAFLDAHQNLKAEDSVPLNRPIGKW